VTNQSQNLPKSQNFSCYESGAELFRAHLAPDLQLPTVLREVADEHARFTHRRSQLQTRTLESESCPVKGTTLAQVAGGPALWLRKLGLVLQPVPKLL